MDSKSQTCRHTVLYLSHGAGPMPILGDDGHKEMVVNLRMLAEKIPKPAAVVVISAHWEAEVATITQAAAPPLIYDYHGFPERAYEIEYPAPGEPALARAVFSVLRNQGIKAMLDDRRGFDHGLFVPLKIMYPSADVPCIQLSLLKSLDPGAHIEIGKALSELAYENLLVIGSGFSFHNMKAFFAPKTAEGVARNEAFTRWLNETCTDSSLGEAERTRRLVNWERAPSARYCHPREEHLLPLHVCCGLANRPCSDSYDLEVAGKRASVYLWR